VESCIFYIRGKSKPGKVHRVKFAHHNKVKRDYRLLNVNPIIARLILGKMATLHELQTIYSFADMMYLDEVLSLKEEQQYLAQKDK
jgi:hypothetical protein